eukprot:4751760-Pleurochrysis_carterae.AAC.1
MGRETTQIALATYITKSTSLDLELRWCRCASVRPTLSLTSALSVVGAGQGNPYVAPCRGALPSV